MGVDVDKAGCDQGPLGIERALGRGGHGSDLDNAASLDAHIAKIGGAAGTIDKGAATDHQIQNRA